MPPLISAGITALVSTGAAIVSGAFLKGGLLAGVGKLSFL